MEALRRNMKISIPESDAGAGLHFPLITTTHAPTSVTSKGISDPSKNVGSEWEKKIIEAMVANQINDFLLNPHLIRGYTEVHKTASTPASASSSSTNYVTEGSTAKVGATNNFAMSGISRPVSVKPVVDTSFANLPSFQPSASSPSPTQSRSEFRPKDSSGSFQPSPTAGASKGMTGRNRRRQLIMECRRLRSDIGKFEDEFSAINQRAPKPTERGSMQTAYAQYKNLKRTVRDEAATDIQRVFRGMRARVAVGFTIGKASSNASVSVSVSASVGAPGFDRTYSPSPRRPQPERGQTSAISSFSPTRHTRPRDAEEDAGGRHQSARRDEGLQGAGVSGLTISTGDAAVKDLSSFGLASPSKRKGDHEGSPPLTSTLAMSPAAKRGFGSSDTYDFTSTSFDHADTPLGGSVTSAEASALSAQHQQRKRKGADVRSPSTSSAMEWLQSPVAVALKAEYRELLAQKTSLKSLLKRFDDDFRSKHGRLPIRKEKEKMRFTYEKYHEIKAAIGKVRAEIESGYGGPLSDDVLLNEESPRERVKRGFTAQSPPSSSSEAGRDPTAASPAFASDLTAPVVRSRAGSFDSAVSFDTRLSTATGEEDASLSLRLSDFEESLAAAGGGGGGASGSGSGSAVRPAATGSVPGSPSTPFVAISVSPAPVSAGGDTSAGAMSGHTTESAVNALLVSELQEEKSRLLATLKSFEREFTRAHGRPVTKHEDIAPVSAEYRRYKEIKAILNE